MKQHWAILGFVWLLASCSFGEGNKESETITIPFEKISLSDSKTDYFRDWTVSGTCLYSDDSGLGQLAGIDKIVASKGDYYVLDRAQRILIRYSSHGKPLNYIGRKGRGPEEYITISDFSINLHGQVVILDGQLDEIIVYNRDGSFVSRKKMPCDYGELFHLGSEEILLGFNAWDNSKFSGSKLVLADASFIPRTIISSFEEGYDKNFVLPHIGFTDYAGKVSYACPIDDHVYIFPKKGGEGTKYLIDFGIEAVEKDQVTNLEKTFPDILNNKTFLLNATLIDESVFIITTSQKGELIDYYVDARENRKIALTPLGIRFLGGSGDSLFFEVMDPDKAFTTFHYSFDTMESCEKRVLSCYRTRERNEGE